MRLFHPLLLAAAALAFAVTAQAQTKWDLPAGYSASNFHTENLVAFAADVDKATAGKLKITVHANGSLFKAPEIKRAVQGGQAQIGEVLISNFSNEWPLFGADALPFLADSYDEATSSRVRRKAKSRPGSIACSPRTRMPDWDKLVTDRKSVV